MKTLRSFSTAQAQAWSQPWDMAGAWVRALVWMSLTALLAGLWCGRAWGEDDAEKAKKEFENRLKNMRGAADLQSALDRAVSDEDKKKIREKMKDAQSKEQGKKDMADFKELVLGNLGAIKEMFAKAEESWKNQKFGEASQLYSSVCMATVPGAEAMVETSRGRIVELEDLAKTHLKTADDNDLKRDYVKEVEELSLINKEFTLTKTREVALRRLITLKTRPEVAGYVEIAQAEALETDGKLMESLAVYRSVAANPRYENSVPSLKARRKLEELDKNEATRTKIKTEMDARADKEAPNLLARAKDFLANLKPKEAAEKLQQVIDKYPNTKYAEEAKKQLAELK